MAEKMFDGVDHTRYKAEAEQRWGKAENATSDPWLRGRARPRRKPGHCIPASWAAKGPLPPSRESRRTVPRPWSWPGGTLTLSGIPGTQAPASATGSRGD